MSRKGFSLIELSLTVAIAGIIAALALPRFMDAQNRARRAEVPANMNGIYTAQMAYHAAHDEYASAYWWPRNPFLPSKEATAWGQSNADWQALGYRPDGEVRGRYSTTAFPSTTFTPGGLFWVDAYTNMDGDAWLCRFRITRYDKDPYLLTAIRAAWDAPPRPSYANCF
ncbi:MAG: prepilin-type N-terminal cleavage/methylation domain-containing protein [Alphaproteobacteria bacterium]|nr:prepilin-type N-terminal cleavage/methylation domain-containing protein [Alphaproteobacteria bacterium]